MAREGKVGISIAKLGTQFLSSCSPTAGKTEASVKELSRANAQGDLPQLDNVRHSPLPPPWFCSFI